MLNGWGGVRDRHYSLLGMKKNTQSSLQHKTPFSSGETSIHAETIRSVISPISYKKTKG